MNRLAHKAGWRELRLSDVIKVKSGDSLSKSKMEDGEFPVFGGNGVSGYHSTYNTDETKIVIGRVGEYCGAVHKTPQYSWITDNALYVHEKKVDINDEYLFFLLDYLALNKYANRNAQPLVSGKTLEQIACTLPSCPIEQQKIAEVLSTVDKKIDLIDQKIAETEKLKTGLMQKLFSEGVGVQDENGEWQPHTEFSSDLLPSSWEVGEVIDFLELQRGHDLPVQKRMGGSVPIIGSNGIAGYHSQAVVEESGVITGRSGTLGKVYFSEGSFWPLNTSLYIRDFKGNNKKYCFYFLEHFNLKRFGTGTGVPTLNRNIVHKQKTAFPSLIEQEKIAEILDTVSQKKQILEQQKAETQQLKKGLMQKLLTGEWRVPVEETEAA
ncbi:TPA: restriction endonuclease subunit S [Vibrio vulnificus]|uniref:restriction endonuclease subunit S n=1 Tax=Vibrio parahaemolyticus TaxID=670 RepID=UPI000407116C|nr:restriction endonuclease subunit S [Vibrio parahaemolyticus]HDY7459793.1 restriction endonuclease subunit S [Vibrio vulnificus]TPA17287.1 restriction endonuclease subunit S [Vibrio parahaemolyticus]HCG8546409.1 restriction endonuclease subunit S [Vibrio parahaemolyticus]HCH0769800.1 restriction endonuclease subunit S [Vibrio parahaemolyticus]HCH1004558.1 restriction endonuclease subunit S [Vibrio parahaemolyticus]